MGKKTPTTLKAIEILTGQQNKLAELPTFDNGVWRTQTKSYIELFFSTDSAEFKYINETDFYVGRGGAYVTYTPLEIQNKTDYQKKIAGDFLTNCIETLEHKGVYQPPKGNFLSRMSDGLIVTILLFAIPGLLWVGNVWGKYLSDTQNIEMKIEIKNLKDTILTLRPTVFQQTNTVPSNSRNTADSTQ